MIALFYRIRDTTIVKDFSRMYVVYLLERNPSVAIDEYEKLACETKGPFIVQTYVKKPTRDEDISKFEKYQRFTNGHPE